MSYISALPKDLASEIEKVLSKFPESEKAFEQLYHYLSKDDVSEKKRKIAVKDEEKEDFNFNIDSIAESTVILQFKDVSFQSPLRKKLSLVIAISPTTQRPYLAITKSLEDKPELIINELNNTNLKLVTLLPFPEKKNQLYLVFFYNRNHQNTHKNEPIVVTLNTELIAKQLGDKLKNTDLTTFLTRQFSICKFSLTDITKNSFFVEAYQKSKEGILYFLPNHIIFGFKKPILLFESSNIDSITYSNITRVTFNVTLVLKNQENFEFGMIDQMHFDKIDTYVKNKNVRDESMSAELKAKSSKNAVLGGEIENAESLLGELNAEQADSDDEEEDATFQAGEEEEEGSASGSEDSNDSDSDEEADLSESLVGSDDEDDSEGEGENEEQS